MYVFFNFRTRKYLTLTFIIYIVQVSTKVFKCALQQISLNSNDIKCNYTNTTMMLDTNYIMLIGNNYRLII